MHTLKVASTLMVFDTMTSQERDIVYQEVRHRVEGVSVYNASGLSREQKWMGYIMLDTDQPPVPWQSWQYIMREWITQLASVHSGTITHDNGLLVTTSSVDGEFKEISSDADGPVTHIYTKEEFFDSIEGRVTRACIHNNVDILAQYRYMLNVHNN